MISRRLSIYLLLCLLCLPIRLPAQNGGGFPGQPHPPRSFHPPTPEEREAARQRMGITVQQQSQIDDIYKDAETKRRAAGATLHDLYDQRRALYDSYSIDQAKERDLRRQIVKQQDLMLKIQNETEIRLRGILNKEQFDRLRQMMKEMRDAAGDRGQHRPFKHGEAPGPTPQ